jgi:hypothetical protein
MGLGTASLYVLSYGPVIWLATRQAADGGSGIGWRLVDHFYAPLRWAMESVEWFDRLMIPYWNLFVPPP